MPTSTPTLNSGPINSGDVLDANRLALVLLMTPGLSFFYGGMVSKKNVISTMMQSFVALGLVSIIWVVVGFSMAFGDSMHGLIGNPFSYFYIRGVGPATDPNLAPTIPLAHFALFQLKFAIITPALITGALAERLKFSSYLLFISLFTIFIYAPLAHWTWHPIGFIHTLGVLDFEGGTVVHMSAGFTAQPSALYWPSRSHPTGAACACKCAICYSRHWFAGLAGLDLSPAQHLGPTKQRPWLF
jgi:Amt family ammonium transporter